MSLFRRAVVALLAALTLVGAGRAVVGDYRSGVIHGCGVGRSWPAADNQPATLELHD